MTTTRKRILFRLPRLQFLALAGSVLLAGACTEGPLGSDADDPTLNVTTDSLRFQSVRGEPLPPPATLTINGNASWTLETTAPWIALGGTAGHGEAHVTVGIHATTLIGEVTDSILVRVDGRADPALAVPVHLTQTARPPTGIVFQRKPLSGAPEAIFSMDPDGSGVRHVSEDAARQIQPSVSMDGEWIAFVRVVGETDAELYNIYKMRIDGSDFSQLTHGTDPRIKYTAPEWTIDGRITFRRRSGAGPYRMLVMNADGTRVEDLETEPCGPLSPEGRRMACARNDQASEQGEIVIRDLRTGEERQVYAGHLVEQGWLSPPVYWSPNGREIAFERGHNWEWNINVLDLETLEVRQLTSTPRGDVIHSWPKWSPDGSRILFLRWDVTGSLVEEGLHVMNREGADLRRLTDNRSDWFPSWVP